LEPQITRRVGALARCADSISTFAPNRALLVTLDVEIDRSQKSLLVEAASVSPYDKVGKLEKLRQRVSDLRT
jgi:hypothetical protein